MIEMGVNKKYTFFIKLLLEYLADTIEVYHISVQCFIDTK